jgi:hypothetical protein
MPKSDYPVSMQLAHFYSTLADPCPPGHFEPPLTALWWDAKGDWTRAHACVDDLETPSAMAVHAYLHRKEGVDWNADYWYRLAGRQFHRPTLEAEFLALLEALLPQA